MTTIAFDGSMMAADSLTEDHWGLKDTAMKIMVGKDFAVGGAGSSHQFLHWWRSVKHMTAGEVLEHGHPNYHKDDNDPAILLVPFRTRVPYKHTGGLFVPCGRSFHAIGSGRDFALAAMHMGKSASEAVRIASVFDNNTNDDISVITFPQ